MKATVHMVNRNESDTYESPVRVLNFIRSMHEAQNCKPDRLISCQRAPGHALVVLKFAKGGHYIIRFHA